MRVAALYDIHGNLPALEAVLADVRQVGVDRIVVGGDVVPGPMPRESLALLLGLEIPVQFIFGNCEVAVLQVMAGKDPAGVPEAVRPVISWTAEQLGPECGRILEGWPKTVWLDVPGLGGVLFCHGTPRDENEVFTRLTPEERLLPAFEGADAAVIVCGHTHMQFDRRIGNFRVVNAGSVGMPFGEPGAYWLLLVAGVQLRRTEYGSSQAAQRIRATAYPQAEQFAAQNVLHPPSEEQMLDVFTRVSLNSNAA